MEIGDVRATYEIRHHRDGTIDDERDLLWNADGAEIAGPATGRGDDLGFACPAKGREAGDLARLDLV